MGGSPSVLTPSGAGKRIRSIFTLKPAKETTIPTDISTPSSFGIDAEDKRSSHVAVSIDDNKDDETEEKLKEAVPVVIGHDESFQEHGDPEVAKELCNMWDTDEKLRKWIIDNFLYIFSIDISTLKINGDIESKDSDSKIRDFVRKSFEFRPLWFRTLVAIPGVRDSKLESPVQWGTIDLFTSRDVVIGKTPSIHNISEKRHVLWYWINHVIGGKQLFKFEDFGDFQKIYSQNTDPEKKSWNELVCAAEDRNNEWYTVLPEKFPPNLWSDRTGKIVVFNSAFEYQIHDFYVPVYRNRSTRNTSDRYLFVNQILVGRTMEGSIIRRTTKITIVPFSAFSRFISLCSLKDTVVKDVDEWEDSYGYIHKWIQSYTGITDSTHPAALPVGGIPDLVISTSTMESLVKISNTLKEMDSPENLYGILFGYSNFYRRFNCFKDNGRGVKILCEMMYRHRNDTDYLLQLKDMMSFPVRVLHSNSTIALMTCRDGGYKSLLKALNQINDIELKVAFIYLILTHLAKSLYKMYMADGILPCNPDRSNLKDIGILKRFGIIVGRNRAGGPPPVSVIWTGTYYKRTSDNNDFLWTMSALGSMIGHIRYDCKIPPMIYRDIGVSPEHRAWNVFSKFLQDNGDGISCFPHPTVDPNVQIQRIRDNFDRIDMLQKDEVHGYLETKVWTRLPEIKRLVLKTPSYLKISFDIPQFT